MDLFLQILRLYTFYNQKKKSCFSFFILGQDYRILQFYTLSYLIRESASRTVTSGSSQKVKLEGEKTFPPSRRQQRPETAAAGPGRGYRLRRSRPPGKPAARGHRSRRPQAPRPRPPRRAATTRVLAAAGAGLAVDRQLVHIMTLRGRTRWGHARRRSHVPPQAAHLGSAGASRLRTAPWGNRHPGEGNSNAALLRT